MNLKIIKNSKGFSLIELMIAMVIFVTIIAVLIASFTRQDQQNTSQNQVIEVQQNLRAGFHMLVSEIRMAGFDPDGIYGAGFSAAGTNSMTFTRIDISDGSDNDGDGSIDEAGELRTVTINLFDSGIDSGATVDEIQIAAAGQPIAENISALQFIYYDNLGVVIPFAGAVIPAADIPTIRAVEITLTAREAESERDMMFDKGGSLRTLVSMINCRNL